MSVKEAVVSAVGWSFGIKIIVQLITWAMTLVVIRLLSPDDYGLMAVSQIAVNFMLGFGSMGLGEALIQQGETPKIVVERVFGVLIVTAAMLTALLCLAAYPIGHWYHDDRLIPLIQVSSLGFPFAALTTLPRRSSGAATAAASATARCSRHTDSTSKGPIR